MKILKIFLLISSISFWISRTKKETMHPSLISPPVEGLDIAYSTYWVMAEEGGTLSHPSGSEISFPPNAFTDSLGQTIKGKVEIRYREFHDAFDAFVSGIPMEFTDGKKTKHFKTAGMMEMRAFQNGKALELAQGKAAQVKMASFYQGDEYQYFFLDEKEKRWNLKGKLANQINPAWQNQQQKARNMTPMKFPFDPAKTFILNYWAFLDITFNDDYSKAYEAQKDLALKQKFDSYGITHFDIWCNEEVSYDGKAYPAAMMVWQFADRNRAFPSWLTEKGVYYSRDVRQLRKDLFRLTFTEYKGKRNFSCKVRAVMPVAFLFRYSVDQWKQNYQKALASAQAEAEKAEGMAKVFRSFEAEMLGIHNCDYFMNDSSAVQVAVTVNWEGQWNYEEGSMEKNAVNTFYLICENNQTLVSYPKVVWENLRINQVEDGKLFTVLPGKKLGIINEKSFKQISFNKEKMVSGEEKVTLYFKDSGEIIESSDQLKAYFKEGNSTTSMAATSP